MMNLFNWSWLNAFPIVGILRGFETPESRQAVKVACEAGLTTVEVALNSEEPYQQIKELASEFGEKMNVGAGTVTSPIEMEKAMEAGASFIVTPVFAPEIIKACNSLKIPIFSGAFTPTEIHAAWRCGADLVKVFPASRLGPEYIREIRGPMSEVRLLPTGGVNLDNALEYLEAGVYGFGLGSSLFQKQQVIAKDWDWIGDQVKSFKKVFKRRIP